MEKSFDHWKFQVSGKSNLKQKENKCLKKPWKIYATWNLTLDKGFGSSGFCTMVPVELDQRNSFFSSPSLPDFRSKVSLQLMRILLCSLKILWWRHKIRTFHLTAIHCTSYFLKAATTHVRVLEIFIVAFCCIMQI